MAFPSPVSAFFTRVQRSAPAVVADVWIRFSTSARSVADTQATGVTGSSLSAMVSVWTDVAPSV